MVKILNFFLIRFLVNFGFNFGRGRRQGRTPETFKNLRTRQDQKHAAARGTPFTPCGVGADLKASPLPPAPLVTSGLLICRLKGLARIERLVSRIEINEK